MEASIQVGAKKWPEHNYKSLGRFLQVYYKGTGLDKSGSHTATMRRKSFADDNFTCVFDLETVPQANHSGYNTSSGSIVISFKGVGDGAANYCSSAVVTLFHDCIAEIGDVGVTVQY